MNHQFKTLKMAAGLVSLCIMLMCANHVKAQDDVASFNVGRFTVTLLSEGQGQGNAGILAGATEEMLRNSIPGGTYPNATNAFLVETGTQNVLFDAGYGRNLFANLQKYGKDATSINAIVLTHMHGDHIGGLLNSSGEKAFPSAEMYIPKPEYDYWMSDAVQNGTQARNVINAYKDRLHLFTPDEVENAQEILPGISSVAAYGHTPGHTGYMLESSGAKMFIWGDLAHAMAIQMPYPEVAVSFDINREQAISYRRKLLQYMAENNIRVAGMHIPFPAIGNVKKNNVQGYEFTPANE
jgi:glyoxylase-like metal-dependent hydrolase (beta-lactamase superfamily II)